MAKSVPEYFGVNVFNDKVMKERLQKDTYDELKKRIEEARPLDIALANKVAEAMKDWALEKGATHFTHWFQPLSGVTAEKHDSFIEPTADGVIMDFSGKALVKGEPDASSFPSGGLRATFEARGYTAWDPTSYAFVKDGSLHIPTAFCSYGGESLDKKTPLLRSMQLIEKQALRIVKLFGNNDVKKVTSTVGPEQEYFLIDKSVYEKRQDLINCGRTLFGARPPKGQELDDHYFGSIKKRVAEYMKDLDEELWKLGIYSKTKHNEVAPAQHELAPIFTFTNLAVDHNQLTMDVMKSVAYKHGLVCLLHEKPFEKVNGSGKHNNWSLSTDTGINLLEPGDTPYDNAQFLLFLLAVVKAVDKHQDLIRISVASAGNDHRLGANEAPPAIVSVFLGEELQEILDAIENKTDYKGKKNTEFEIGVDFLPQFPKDKTDRNRTSPIAFTGNKFEFRMVGSSFSVAEPNTVLNTIVAETLDEFASILEKADDFKEQLNKLIVKTIKEHKRIIFNGNNYSSEWVIEAGERGLLNLPSTVDALPYYILQKNIDLFGKYHILSKNEILSRYEIQLESYSKTINIEALTAIDMTNQEIIPSIIEYKGKIAKEVKNLRLVNPQFNCGMEEKILFKLSKLSASLYEKLTNLTVYVKNAENIDDIYNRAKYFREFVLTEMNSLREVADEIELTVGKKYWNFPTYADILYSVKY